MCVPPPPPPPLPRPSPPPPGSSLSSAFGPLGYPPGDGVSSGWTVDHLHPLLGHRHARDEGAPGPAEHLPGHHRHALRRHP